MYRDKDLYIYFSYTLCHEHNLNLLRILVYNPSMDLHDIRLNRHKPRFDTVCSGHKENMDHHELVLLRVRYIAL
jgi:hypothetical protein